MCIKFCGGPLLRVIAAFFLLVASSAFAADHIDVTNEFFGMHVHAPGRGAPANFNSFGYIRLWDSNVTWAKLEPQQGRWNFEVLDHYVAGAQRAGVKVLLTLGQTPEWASSTPKTKSPYGPGASGPPRDSGAWSHYIQTVASRYKGRIHAYEIWNEVNVGKFYSGDWRTLIELERAAVDRIRRIDPEAVVLSASIQGGAFREFEEYVAAGGARSVDALSYHFYALSETPEAVPGRVRKVRQILERHGLGRLPIWNTETGWLFSQPKGEALLPWISETRNWTKPKGDDAAGFVLRTLLMNLHSGISHVFWYAWDNGVMGLVDPMSQELLSSGHGYMRARDWLSGAVFEGCSNVRGVWFCNLRRNDRRQQIVWAIAPTRLAYADLIPHLSATSLTGIDIPRSSDGSYRINSVPTLFQ